VQSGGGKGGGNAFTKPLELSDALTDFFGGEKGLSRPELTKRFWAYFKENGLQDPKDKRCVFICPLIELLDGGCQHRSRRSNVGGDACCQQQQHVAQQAHVSWLCTVSSCKLS
jgi:hypothetical protein